MLNVKAVEAPKQCMYVCFHLRIVNLLGQGQSGRDHRLKAHKQTYGVRCLHLQCALLATKLKAVAQAWSGASHQQP